VSFVSPDRRFDTHQWAVKSCLRDPLNFLPRLRQPPWLVLGMVSSEATPVSLVPSIYAPVATSRVSIARVGQAIKPALSPPSSDLRGSDHHPPNILTSSLLYYFNLHPTPAEPQPCSSPSDHPTGKFTSILLGPNPRHPHPDDTTPIRAFLPTIPRSPPTPSPIPWRWRRPRRMRCLLWSFRPILRCSWSTHQFYTVPKTYAPYVNSTAMFNVISHLFTNHVIASLRLTRRLTGTETD
jgi:hypothetical protein